MPWTVCPPVRLICFLATTRKRMPLSISLFARVLSRLADWRSWPHKLRLTSPLLDGILNVDHRLAIVGHPVRIGDIVPRKKVGGPGRRSNPHLRAVPFQNQTVRLQPREPSGFNAGRA